MLAERVTRPHNRETLSMHNSQKAVLLGGALVTMIAIGGWASLSGATTRPYHHRIPFTASRIPMLAKAIAAEAGDPNPILIQHVSGRRGAAVRLAGGDVIFGTDAQRGARAARGAKPGAGGRMPGLRSGGQPRRLGARPVRRLLAWPG
jgi:hypothetical protein